MSEEDEHRRIADELGRALRRADDLVRVRDQFLRLAGHELRSPLTAIELQIDTLVMAAQQGVGVAGIEERAGRIRRSVHKLGWIVEEVLDLGRAAAGGLTVRLADEDLVVLAHRATDRLVEEVRRSGCELRVLGVGTAVGMWDGPRVEHALGSLLLAAMRSGAGAPLELEIEADELEARAVVRDRGPGLPAGQMELALEPFDQMLAGLQAGSPMLGLWLARSVAEAHGGRLVVEANRLELHLPKTGRPPPALIAVEEP